jgi:hypothetical protein
MPQLDIDLFDDFLFFAFVSILFGFGDEDVDENIIEVGGEAYLNQYYIETKQKLEFEQKIVKVLCSKSLN